MADQFTTTKTFGVGKYQDDESEQKETPEQESEGDKKE